MLRKRLATSGKPSESAMSANAGYRSLHSSFSPSAAAWRFSAVVPFRLPAGIGRGDLDHAALEELEEHLGVLLLVHRRLGEDGGDLLVALLLRDLGEERVAVARLALAGERLEKVLLRLAALELGHPGSFRGIVAAILSSGGLGEAVPGATRGHAPVSARRPRRTASGWRGRRQDGGRYRRRRRSRRRRGRQGAGRSTPASAAPPLVQLAPAAAAITAAMAAASTGVMRWPSTTSAASAAIAGSMLSSTP